MKKGFNDPIAKNGSQKKMKSPWNFDCPEYDERTSCFVNAGSHYGVGHRQPVGHHGNPKEFVYITYTYHKAMKDDEVPHKNIRLDVEE